MQCGYITYSSEMQARDVIDRESFDDKLSVRKRRSIYDCRLPKAREPVNWRVWF